jgi:hypothetical protein
VALAGWFHVLLNVKYLQRRKFDSGRQIGAGRRGLVSLIKDCNQFAGSTVSLSENPRRFVQSGQYSGRTLGSRASATRLIHEEFSFRFPHILRYPGGALPKNIARNSSRALIKGKLILQKIQENSSAKERQMHAWW